MHNEARRHSLQNLVLVALAWGSAWSLMLWLDSGVALTPLVTWLVLASALVSAWLPVSVSLSASLLAVLVFDWLWVPPHDGIALEGHRPGLLLLATLGLAGITGTLMARLRSGAARAHRQAASAEQLRAFSEHLRDEAQPRSLAPLLQTELQQLFGESVSLMLLKGLRPASNLMASVTLLGPAPEADQYAGLWLCLRSGHAFGPGSGRHEELPAWYLPLRGRAASHGAVILQLRPDVPADPGLRAHAQSLCDQMGLALERLAAEHAAQQARDEAGGQATRNALLAAISHDYRTPLACIMSAASSLQDQDGRLSPAQRRRLAATILDQTEALSRMTDNSLQLVRLDAPGLVLKLDWESAEEIVGAVLRRVRQRRANRVPFDAAVVEQDEVRLRARLEPGLPLLRCDAVLLSQMLDNLVDNALKYGGKGNGGLEILVRTASEGERNYVVLAVRDRGPGVEPAWRERIFEVFQRGAEVNGERPDASTRRGAGVGLAACRAIAHAHGGMMRLRSRSHGGASFECWLPVVVAPQAEEAGA